MNRRDLKNKAKIVDTDVVTDTSELQPLQGFRSSDSNGINNKFGKFPL